MKEMTMEEILKLQLRILKEFNDYCNSQKLNYCLAFGSLIGAVRHGGYIPWDDDIDVAMPRPDYNRLLEITGGRIGELRIAAPEYNPNYYAPYANLYDPRTILIEGKGQSYRGIGVKIDIFPIDGADDDFNRFLKVNSKIARWNDILAVKRARLSLHRDITQKLLFLIKKTLFLFSSYSSIQNKIIKTSQLIDINKTNHVAFLTFTNKGRKRFFYFDKEVFSRYVDVEFEGSRFKMPERYDDYLRTCYGNYMEFPPLEKQVPHHYFNAFWKD